MEKHLLVDQLFAYLDGFVREGGGFQGLPASFKRMLPCVATTLNFDIHQIIVHPGEVPHFCAFLGRGVVREYESGAEGKKTFYRFHEAGHPIIPFGFMEQRTTSCYMEAMANCAMLTANLENLLRLFAEFPEINHLFRMIMSSYAEKGLERERILAIHSKSERIASLHKERPQLFNAVPAKHLASYVGVTPSFFSKARKQLSRQRDL